MVASIIWANHLHISKDYHKYLGADLKHEKRKFWLQLVYRQILGIDEIFAVSYTA